MAVGRTNVRSGGGYKNSVVTGHGQNGLSYYTIPCGGKPLGFTLFATLGYPTYKHMYYCDLASDILFYDGIKYSAKQYVTISGNNAILDLTNTLGNTWEAMSLGFS